MKIAFLLLALTPFGHAFATSLPKIAPQKPGEPATCFQREYTPEYMRSHPGQLLRAMYIKVSYKHEMQGPEEWDWLAGEVVGIHNNNYYGNTAGCAIQEDGYCFEFGVGHFLFRAGYW